MRNKVMLQKLLDFKARQLEGFHMVCPRCGLNLMDSAIHRNAYSRYAPVYICTTCEIDEDMGEIILTSLPLGEWAAFAPQRIQERFIDMPAEETWEILKREQVPYLAQLFQQSVGVKTKRELRSYQRAALENCPGLELLMFNPCYGRYETRDGQLVVKFDFKDGEIEVTHKILPTI